jgi:cell division protein FtsQ
MARNAVARRPRGGAATPARPTAFRLWLRRQRGLVRPACYALALLAILGAGAVGAMALDPASRIAAFAASFPSSGLAVRSVLVEGRRNAPAEELRRALGVQPGDGILAFSPHAARARLERMPWVASATVERRLPDTILVRIEERQPYALWRDGKVTQVIDRAGTRVSAETDAFGLLPLVVGPGAAEHAAHMVELLRAEPELRDRTEELVRVGNRRWNLKLRNGTEVRLPETGEAAALARLREQHRAIGLLDRPVAVIDLRLPDKMTVQLAPSAPPPPPQPAVRSVRG